MEIRVRLAAIGAAMLVLGACASSTGSAVSTSTLAPVGVTEPVGTLPPRASAATTAPPTTAPPAATTATTAAATTAPTTVAGRPASEMGKADTWPVAGSVSGDSNASVIVFSDPKGTLCVGIRLSVGGVRDACGEAGQSWYAVLPGPDRLYVVAGRAPDAHLVLAASSGTIDAAPLPVGASAAHPFGVVGVALPRGAGIVSIDGGDDQSACSYPALFGALGTSGAVGTDPVALRIEQCGPSAVGAVLPGGSLNPQGAQVLFDRGPDGQWDFVNIGSDVCVAPSEVDPATISDAQRALLDRTASVCGALGR